MSADIEFGLLLCVFLGIVVLCAKPLGGYIADVMQGKRNFALRAGGRFEIFLYHLSGVDPAEEMAWPRYAIAVLLFNVLGAVFVYALQRLQPWLPLNPQHFAAVGPDSSFNTAVSFVTNTDWQAYSGESTMGYLAQMAGLAVQNFLSAATGIAVAIAVIRGFVRHGAQAIGNFWVDVTRATLYVLLPLSVVLALVLASQGVIQNFAGYKDATTVATLTFQNPKTGASGAPIKDSAGNPVTETASAQTQILPMGPIASQESIKELGYQRRRILTMRTRLIPYENPTALDELAGDAGHLHHSDRPHLHVRQDGRRFATRMGGVVRHAHPFRRRWRCWRSTASSTAIHSSRSRGSTRSRVSRSPAATWRVRRPVSASQRPRFLRLSRPRRPAGP